ncbi:NADH-quinone oxidoreductase subunit NuoN [Usitatibacter palustris]|uniref:NADH-quinone oxidoreductase subunit N n=1 Tax=Usitatibacter palustris TaxID=2732487 RepID=A0A6M4H914_9PROT|nr:NADH-quinone oxidoreductase subunit NuoN [Usitatibacter palustris]QJR16071.1 NADH-quinone oxidoreductase subunit N [Usitatibacter palustris]
MNAVSLSAFAPAIPEIALLILASVLLVFDLFVKDNERHVSYWFAVAALVGCAGLALAGVGHPAVLAFNGVFVADMMSQVLKVAALLAVAATLLYSRPYLEARGLLTGEILSLALFATLGMMVMISAHHFLTLYLGLELLALSSYAMVALQRDSVRATEAAMKYFVLGALASGLLLYGLSMIYGATGSLQIAEVAQMIERSQANHTLLVLGVVFSVAGVAFKLGAVPFHMWIPDVYHGASTPVTLFIGGAPKIAAFAFVLRLFANGLQGMTADWAQMFAILAVASLALGNVVAIAQGNLKRMLAYSTISHMGFLLLGILAGNDNGYSSAMFYVIAYVLMTLAAFGMILLLTRAGFEAESLDDWKGLNKKSKWYAFLMLLVMFSLAGIPPTVGFFAKFAVLQAVLVAGWTWLVVFAVLMSVIGAFYYLRIVRLMYMDEPAGEITISPRADLRWALSINALAILALGIFPAPLFDLCARAIAASM